MTDNIRKPYVAIEKKILLYRTKYRNCYKRYPVVCVLFTLYEIVQKKNVSCHDLEWVVLFVCWSPCWQVWPPHSSPGSQSQIWALLNVTRKKTVETGLLSADPSQDRLGHNFLPGHLRTNLNGQAKARSEPWCSVLEKEKVLLLLLMITRELSDG